MVRHVWRLENSFHRGDHGCPRLKISNMRCFARQGPILGTLRHVEDRKRLLPFVTDVALPEDQILIPPREYWETVTSTGFGPSGATGDCTYVTADGGAGALGRGDTRDHHAHDVTPESRLVEPEARDVRRDFVGSLKKESFSVGTPRFFLCVSVCELTFRSKVNYRTVPLHRYTFAWCLGSKYIGHLRPCR
jgi:hypothetical protein